MDTDTEELRAARSPREVTDAAGSWIGAALAVHGFGWLAKTRTVQRQADGVLHQIALQPSSYNRTGKHISIGTYVAVRDPALRRWRLAHPTVAVPPHDDDYVCGHLLGYTSGRAGGYVYGDAQDGELDLTEPAERPQRLRRFVAMVEQGVLPWFTEAGQPDSIVDARAGDSTNNPVALMEWLASRGRIDLVQRYAERYRKRHPGIDQRWAEGVAAAVARRPSPPGGDDAMAMGWSATMLTTADPTG